MTTYLINAGPADSGSAQPTPIADQSTVGDGRSGGSAPAVGSWEEIVRTHSADVYRHAYHLTGNPYDAEDLTQDVFVRVFRFLDTYRPGTFAGWLRRITTNLFLDRVRHQQRIRFDALADDASNRFASREPTPDQAFDVSTLDEEIRTALDGLAPHLRVAVVLCDLQGLSYGEIAATAGIKLGTVSSRIHRGRAQLRTALAHRAPRPPHPAPAA